MQDINNDIVTHDPTKSFIAKVIEWSVNNKLLIMAFMLTLLIAGIFAIKKNTS